MRKIYLENHNEQWIHKFQQEIRLIKSFFNPEIVECYHIGSTAVRGLKAKPVIDIMISVKSINNVENYNKNFAKLGYDAKGEYGIKSRRFFTKGGDNRTFHLHIFESGNPEIEKHLCFRDALINDKTFADKYEKLKSELCEKFSNNPEAYTEGKNNFIRSFLILKGVLSGSK